MRRSFGLFLVTCWVACGPASAGEGSKSCEERCQVLAELCQQETEACKKECRADNASKTTASIGAVDQCVADAKTCDDAKACKQKLEDRPDPPAPTPTPTPNPVEPGGRQRTAALAICSKLVGCGMPADRRSECVTFLGGSLTFMYVVDTALFSSCLQGKSCDQLEANPEGVAKECLHLDEQGIVCQGDALTVCNDQGNCMTLDCPHVCQAIAGGSYAHCGLDSDDGHDKCFCSL